MRPLACVILAAGQGTRMKSELPKPLHQVCGRPMIDHVLTTVGELAAERTVVVVSPGSQRLVAALGEGITVCEQPEQLGTGHAAMCARAGLVGFTGDVLVTYADIPLVTAQTLERLVGQHRAASAAATVLTTELADPAGYGRIVRDRAGGVLAIVEERDATGEQRAIREINTGIYVFDADALRGALERLTPDNEQGEYYLTDAIAILVGDGLPVAALSTDDPDEVMGINTRVQLAQAERIARDRVRGALMLAGVTLIDPPSTFIDAGVRVGRDSVVGPGCQLLGATTVGEGCEIRSGVVLRSASIGNAVLLRDHTVIDESTVLDEAQVGPFALVRGGSVVGRDCRVGSSAEMNRSRLGDGSKMQHFSYLGDTTTGRNCNIGAGVITCNYDGYTKHPTVLEDDVFLGSDTILVAPVTVGAGAYTAAGSVITADVPPGALAVARARQKNIEGWVERRRGEIEGREKQ
ncbi:MAG: bifunctional UDP-N-acetylglucosamine diphosphorylase/glucosamine-1-phosphate N-acetyltransferase GlmU [Armatimonadota bacterium]